MGGPLKFGVIGVGKISAQYFASLPSLPGLELVAVADLDEDRARQAASEQNVEAMSVSRLLDDGRVQAVLNLTIPAAHAEVAVRALHAGKHVYTEKPLAVTPAEATKILAAAKETGLRVGSAPDTVLGTGIQTARQQLDDGAIGQPVGATAFWASPGHERWHPAPQFYYQQGAGPLYDMGPYYISALVTMLGPVVRVSGAVARSARERIVESGPSSGERIAVDVDTHVTAILEHASGVASTVTMSFDVWASVVPNIEVYGTSGTLGVPDPNHFSDPVRIWTKDDPEWRTVAPTAGYADASRGYGLADLGRAIETGRPHRASAQLAFHVLEIMDAILKAGSHHQVISLTSTVERPEPVPLGVLPNTW
ncbi:MAG: oxidoreductase [Glaciihabitans sp.]|nr:oxidoreductase [Glaciihabitans sp.]